MSGASHKTNDALAHVKAWSSMQWSSHNFSAVASYVPHYTVSAIARILLFAPAFSDILSPSSARSSLACEPIRMSAAP